MTTGPPGSFSVEMELDDGKLLVVEVNNAKAVADSLDPYYRWIGSMTGRLVEERRWMRGLLFLTNLCWGPWADVHRIYDNKRSLRI